MIIDTLDNLHRYSGLNPLIGSVVEFISAHDLDNLSIGRHIIKDDDLFVNIDLSKGKTREEAQLEFHRRMTDIQIPLSCEEQYGWVPIASVARDGYDEGRDIGFDEHAKPFQYVRLTPGMFVIFEPQDAHAPLITNEETIKKAIFKIKSI